MNPHKREAASLVPDEFGSRAQIVKRRTRNDALAGASVASAGGVVFGVRWLDAALAVPFFALLQQLSYEIQTR